MLKVQMPYTFPLIESMTYCILDSFVCKQMRKNLPVDHKTMMNIQSVRFHRNVSFHEILGQ